MILDSQRVLTFRKFFLVWFGAFIYLFFVFKFQIFLFYFDHSYLNFLYI